MEERSGDRFSIEYLVDHREAIPVLAGWFRAEWPAWYGPGGPGDLDDDLRRYANRGSVPVGLVAIQDGLLCAAGALRESSIPTHAHLTPWATAGYVVPSLRRRGVGRALLSAIEREAEGLGFPRLYCATATSFTLLEREGWCLIDTLGPGRGGLRVYEKQVSRSGRLGSGLQARSADEA